VTAIEVVPATAERWDDVVAVMGRRGDPSRCLCQYFRVRGKAWSDSDASERRSALRTQVSGDPPPGVLAYDLGTTASDPGTTPDLAPARSGGMTPEIVGRKVVGWCAIAPREAYPRVVASPNWRWPKGDPEGVWTVTCFVVPPGQRRRGISQALLSGAVDLAASYGASAVEGCAVDTARVGRTSAANLYRGPLSTFLGEGFAVVRDDSPSWVLVRKTL
jgi:ribosomal protein S18 acetylase RimI-like enzyme